MVLGDKPAEAAFGSGVVIPLPAPSLAAVPGLPTRQMGCGDITIHQTLTGWWYVVPTEARTWRAQVAVALGFYGSNVHSEDCSVG